MRQVSSQRTKLGSLRIRAVARRQFAQRPNGSSDCVPALRVDSSMRPASVRSTGMSGWETNAAGGRHCKQILAHTSFFLQFSSCTIYKYDLHQIVIRRWHFRKGQQVEVIMHLHTQHDNTHFNVSKLITPNRPPRRSNDPQEEGMIELTLLAAACTRKGVS